MPFIQDSSLELQHIRLMFTRPLCRHTDWFTAENREIFGKGGMITSILKRLAQREENGGIQFLMEIVLQQALAVAAVWDESRISGHRSAHDMPNYHWYILSLMETRSIFVTNCYKALSGTDDERWLRERIVDLPIVDLWNAFWKIAQKYASMGASHVNTNYLRKIMYRWVLAEFVYFEDVGPELQYRIRCIIIRKFHAEYDTEHRPSDMVHVVELTRDFDFSFIPDADLKEYRHYLCLHWGMFLYPEETKHLDDWMVEEIVPARRWEESTYDYDCEEEEDDSEDDDWSSDYDSDDESDDDEMTEEALRRQYDTSHLEACGPEIRPLEIADQVTNAPEHQNCTICVEEFAGEDDEQVEDGQRCLQLPNCGHFFHHDCISAWINGVAPNSNLCPECRGTMFENRRSVRAICVEENPRISAMPVVFDEEE